MREETNLRKKFVEQRISKFSNSLDSHDLQRFDDLCYTCLDTYASFE